MGSYQAGPGLGAVFLAGTGVVLSSILKPLKFKWSSSESMVKLKFCLNSFDLAFMFPQEMCLSKPLTFGVNFLDAATTHRSIEPFAQPDVFMFHDRNCLK